MLIEQLTLTNILSFGPEPETVTFGPLTVLIGANGSGKSNLLSALDVLKNAPDQLLRPIQEGGGFEDWLWKGSDPQADITIEAILPPRNKLISLQSLRYAVSFGSRLRPYRISSEYIETAHSEAHGAAPEVYYEWGKGIARIRFRTDLHDIDLQSFDPNRSILAQRRDPENLRAVTDLADQLGQIRLHREWSFGRYTPPRMPQRADMPIGWLESDGGNLGLILNRLASDPLSKARVLDALKELYDGINDFGVDIVSNSVQVFLHEGRFKIPATRLSDGTLRYLCLLAILCHPHPPPLVCIEEPELGLHPDIIRTVAKLLKEASKRCQLIVTTHSEVLVDAMTDTPEAVVVCEKHDGATKLRRLSPDDLKPWLERYSLGQLWTRGDIGGNRW